jgi:hypothetical protein
VADLQVIDFGGSRAHECAIIDACHLHVRCRGEWMGRRERDDSGESHVHACRRLNGGRSISPPTHDRRQYNSRVVYLASRRVHNGAGRNRLPVSAHRIAKCTRSCTSGSTRHIAVARPVRSRQSRRTGGRTEHVLSWSDYAPPVCLRRVHERRRTADHRLGSDRQFHLQSKEARGITFSMHTTVGALHSPCTNAMHLPPARMRPTREIVPDSSCSGRTANLVCWSCR